MQFEMIQGSIGSAILFTSTENSEDLLQLERSTEASVARDTCTTRQDLQGGQLGRGTIHCLYVATVELRELSILCFCFVLGYLFLLKGFCTPRQLSFNVFVNSIGLFSLKICFQIYSRLKYLSCLSVGFPSTMLVMRNLWLLFLHLCIYFLLWPCCRDVWLVFFPALFCLLLFNVIDCRSFSFRPFWVLTDQFLV